MNTPSTSLPNHKDAAGERPHVMFAAMPPVGTVEAWTVDLRDVPPTLDRLLCDAERRRAEQLRSEQARQLWCAARATLRHLIGADTGVDPTTLGFELCAHGKPRLARSLQVNVRFNVSHSGTAALYALCADREVGVDIELAGRNPAKQRNEVAIAARVLGEEVADRLAGLSDREREREFLRAWVAHEAKVKCLGVGLGAAEPKIGEESVDRSEVWVRQLDVGSDAFAALAVEGGPVAVRLRAWEPLWTGRIVAQ